MYKLSDGIPKHLTDMLDVAMCLQMSILEASATAGCCTPTSPHTTHAMSTEAVRR